MKKHPGTLTRMYFICAALAVSAVALSSCVTSPNEGRGSLSDAMDKGKDESNTRRVPDERPNDNPQSGICIAAPSNNWRNNDNGGMSVDTEPVNADGFFGVRGGRGISSSGDMGLDTDADVILGAGAANLDALLYAGFKSIEPVQHSDLDQSISGQLLILRAGGEVRYLPLGDIPVFCPYIGAGIGGFIMGWTFRNPLTDGDEIIAGDSLTGCVLSVCAGVYPVRTDSLVLGFSIIPEVYLYNDLTMEGFTNDYFSPYGTVKLMGEILFR